MRAAVYCRISRDPSGLELGVQRQERDCRELCEREGFEIVDVFVDDDRSAYSGKRRPRFEAMKELVRGGGVDVLVAWHPDRVTRQPRELEDLIDMLDSTSTTVRTCQTGEYDLSTPAGRMSARIVGAVARHESEHKSHRLRRKHLELAENGAVAGGGPRPFGYEADRITIRESEAAIVRETVKRMIAGESVRSLCRELNDRGVTTTSGIAWKPTTLRDTMRRARLAGLRDHRTAGRVTAVWPAIISVDDHYRVNAVLNDPARRTNSGGRERKLLTGLLVCGRCGRKLVSRPRENGTATYVCVGGPGEGCLLRIIGEPLDELVTAAALHRLSSPAMDAALAPPDDDEAILIELRGVETRRDELAAMWANGELDQRQWAAATKALDKREAELERQLRESASERATVADVEGIADRWPDLSNDRRRAVLAALIDSIEITPVAVRGRNKFDPDRVTVRWKA